ncbi:MAG: DUF917 domain-containing protein [Alphaproteobacteria bacterium]|nr:DUF917 domain-containing protein [Alphaproteobacteria bacterium]
MQRIGLDDLGDLALGAAFLGTGGGGDPYIGRLLATTALAEHGPVALWPLADVPDDALVVPVGNMGAPTVLFEKIPAGHEPLAALRKLEAYLGRRADAVMPIEAGGVNSMLPLVIAAQARIPVVDADGMGRAFPELQMETFNVYGVAATPMVVCNEWGDAVVIEAHSAKMAEWLARGVTIRMGGQTSVAEYAMDGKTARRVSVPGTLGLCLRIGRGLHAARRRHADPFATLIALLKDTHYGFAKVLFRGKLVALHRETKHGFAIGYAAIEGLDDWSGRLVVTFQNENLEARVNGTVKAIVPDLICLLDSETAEPVTTERLRYGQRLTAMGVSVPPIMRTPAALQVFGPQAFGLSEPFRPIEANS